MSPVNPNLDFEEMNKNPLCKDYPGNPSNCNKYFYHEGEHEVDNFKITEKQLFETKNAQVWAEAFMERFEHRKDEIDEGLMIGWFANTIETAIAIQKRKSFEECPNCNYTIDQNEWRKDFKESTLESNQTKVDLIHQGADAIQTTHMERCAPSVDPQPDTCYEDVKQLRNIAKELEKINLEARYTESWDGHFIKIEGSERFPQTFEKTGLGNIGECQIIDGVGVCHHVVFCPEAERLLEDWRDRNWPDRIKNNE